MRNAHPSAKPEVSVAGQGVAILAQDRAAVSGGLLISGNSVRQDAEGRFCLNDLHAAAGGARRHGPSLWLANQQTQGLIAELADAGIPVSTRRSGQARGTFVVRELVYAYGMWISPGFHLRVIRAFDALASQQRAQPALNLRDPKQLAAVAQQLVELNDDLRGQVEAMQVTVEAHARIADADGSTCITDAAKTLQVRPKDLFAWLGEHRWIYQRPGCSGWLAYQERIQQGVLEHKVTTIPLSDGGEKVTFQVRVTAKGLARLAELISPSEPTTHRRLLAPQQKSGKGARAC